MPLNYLFPLNYLKIHLMIPLNHLIIPLNYLFTPLNYLIIPLPHLIIPLTHLIIRYIPRERFMTPPPLLSILYMDLTESVLT